MTTALCEVLARITVVHPRHLDIHHHSVGNELLHQGHGLNMKTQVGPEQKTIMIVVSYGRSSVDCFQMRENVVWPTCFIIVV
jgi:hypothetical protein